MFLDSINSLRLTEDWTAELGVKPTFKLSICAHGYIVSFSEFERILIKLEQI